MTVDVSDHSFSLVDQIVYDGLQIRLAPSNSAVLPDGLARWGTYYVVNSQDESFQLSETPDGPAVAFSGELQGRVFAELHSFRFLEHDPAVHYWASYAAENIAEARKFDHEVIAWLSPSIQSLGQTYLDKNFFRMQLDQMFELADGVAINNPPTSAGALLENRGWWEVAGRIFRLYSHSHAIHDHGTTRQ